MTKAFYDQLWSHNTFKYSPSKLLRERQILYLVDQQMSRCKDWSFLDLGCGRGSLLRKIGKKYKGLLLAGADYSNAAIALNRNEMPEVDFKVLDFQSSKLSESFSNIDCIVSQEVIEHLPRSVHLQFMSSIKHMLNDNGIAIISTPDWESIQGLRMPNESDDNFALRFEGQPNANLLTRRELADLAGQAGFKICWHKTVCPYLFYRKLSSLFAMGLVFLPRFIESALLSSGIMGGKYQIVLLKKLSG